MATVSQPLPRLGWGGREGRCKMAHCFPILCLQRMIMDAHYWWHIFMMDGTAEAGAYPAGIVCLLIKWQIVNQEMCICPWSHQTFFFILICHCEVIVCAGRRTSGGKYTWGHFTLEDLCCVFCRKWLFNICTKQHRWTGGQVDRWTGGQVDRCVRGKHRQLLHG